MQARDIVIFQGQEYSLIDPYKINDFVGEFGLDYIVTSTCRTGCDAQYVIRDGKLFLDRLSVYLGTFADYPSINGVMPTNQNEDAGGALRPSSEIGGQYENIGLLVQYTGIVEIGKDYNRNKDICMGPFECNYRTKLLLKFENGILESCQDISSRRGKKILARTFPKEQIAPKRELFSIVPEGVPKKNIYAICGEQYTFLCFLGFIDREFTPWFHDSGLFQTHTQIPFGIGGIVDHALYPAYKYKLDAGSEAQLQGLWFPLHQNDNVEKVEIFGQKPDKIVGESPRFACFSFCPPIAVRTKPTGFLLLGADGDGTFPWNYGKVIIARLYNGQLWDTQDVSDELTEARQWTKANPSAANVPVYMGQFARYEPFINALPELYKKRPWWFLEISHRRKQIDYAASSIIGTDEFAKLLLKEKGKQDAILKDLETDRKEWEAKLKKLRHSSLRHYD